MKAHLLLAGALMCASLSAAAVACPKADADEAKADFEPEPADVAVPGKTEPAATAAGNRTCSALRPKDRWPDNIAKCG